MLLVPSRSSRRPAVTSSGDPSPARSRRVSGSRAAMGAAPTLVLEIDMTGKPADVAAAVQQHGMFAPGSPGYAGLAPERRARIEGALRKQGIDPAAVAQLKPWMLMTMLAVFDTVKLGYDPTLGVDDHLATLARSGKTRVAELETMQYQAALLNRLETEKALSKESEAELTAAIEAFKKTFA